MITKTKIGRGGTGRGQGRKAADGATNLIQTAVRVTPEQKEKLARLGGSVWIRRAINKAREPGEK